MNIIHLLTIIILTAYPTTDGRRVDLINQPVYQTTIPYWLGISVPPPNIEDIRILWCGTTYNLPNFEGTDSRILYINTGDSVSFYVNDKYQGKIVPEPTTLWVLLGSLLFGKENKWKRKKCMNG
jgi:hypothetical protein